MTPIPIPTGASRSRLFPILMMCGATVCFSVLDATAKYLAEIEHIEVAEIVFIRFAGHVVFSLVLLWPLLGMRPTFRSKKPGLQLLRSVFMLGATAFNFVAVQYLQLDQTITIFFLTPLLVAAIAGPLLGEWVGWRRLAAICVGFLGAIVVTRPGFGGIHWAVTLSFAATLSYALYNVATRYLAAYDPAEVTNSYSPLMGLLLSLPFAVVAWSWPDDPWVWFILASLGVTGGIGHYLLIIAHQSAPAPVLAPFVYVGLISMTILGYLMFGDVPTAWTLVGGAIVIASGLYLLLRERMRGQSPAPAPAPEL